MMAPRSRWLGIAELLTPQRPPTPLERQAIADVHAIAIRFTAGSCSLAEVQAATTPKQRHLATRYTTSTHPAWRPLLLLLDALLAGEPSTVVTKQGVFLLSDLIAAGMRIVRDDGVEVIQLPHYRPWRTRPDPDRGSSGIPAEPSYRSLDERGPSYGSFGNAQPSEPKTAQREWWEMESSDEVPF
jgi:hypothetical protein